jgi:hypothetical protein
MVGHLSVDLGGCYNVVFAPQYIGFLTISSRIPLE